MSNKETPVSWFMEQVGEKNSDGFYVISTLEDVQRVFQTALQIEANKQQKYDEMLAMLEKAEMYLREVSNNKFLANKIEQLIKEAKEL
jgi:hypothetical protein